MNDSSDTYTPYMVMSQKKIQPLETTEKPSISVITVIDAGAEAAVMTGVDALGTRRRVGPLDTLPEQQHHQVIQAALLPFRLRLELPMQLLREPDVNVDGLRHGPVYPTFGLVPVMDYTGTRRACS